MFQAEKIIISFLSNCFLFYLKENISEKNDRPINLTEPLINVKNDVSDARTLATTTTTTTSFWITSSPTKNSGADMRHFSAAENSTSCEQFKVSYN